MSGRQGYQGGHYASQRNVLLVRLQGSSIPAKAAATLHTICAAAIAPKSQAIPYAHDFSVGLDPYTVAVVETRAE